MDTESECCLKTGEMIVTRLSRAEILKHKMWLAEWHVPEKMKHYVNDVNNYMGSKDFVNQAGIEFLRDAWVAAEFADLRVVRKVRLVADEWPDFELQISNRIDQFECVEADELSRRRGIEYREVEELAGPDGILIENDPVENWIERANKVPELLRRAVEKKIGKHYASKTQLLIYLNINEFGVRQQEIESCFQEATKSAHGVFDAVWILWKKNIYQPWSHMSPRTVIVHTPNHARTALGAAAELGIPIHLRSAPGAAAYIGAAVFREMIAAAATVFPAANFTAVLDCGDQPGLALNALRRGIKAVRIDVSPDVAERIADIAAQSDAIVDTSDGPALDLLDVEDPETALRTWLSADPEEHP